MCLEQIIKKQESRQEDSTARFENQSSQLPPSLMLRIGK